MSEKNVKLSIATESQTDENRLAVLKTYKIYIDGKFPRTESGRYYELRNSKNQLIANVSQSSRKDFRDAVTAARNAQPKWAKMTAYNRGQILYRIAEMLEGRKAQFIEELEAMGASTEAARIEVNQSIDRFIYFAGWSDKLQQVFSSVNPVQSSHFNFSVQEPTGVVSVIAPETSALLGLCSVIASSIVAGNTAIFLASSEKPLCSITLAEVLQTSDLPAGVVNTLTGFRKELVSQFAAHMDVNAVIYCGEADENFKIVQTQSIDNLKRVIRISESECLSDAYENPYRILETQEVKTTWHPIGI